MSQFGGKWKKSSVFKRENFCFDQNITDCSQKPNEDYKYRSQSGLRNAHCGLQYETREQNSKLRRDIHS